MSMKIVQLPWQAEMGQRLLAVAATEHGQGLYLILLRSAGKKMVAADVAMTVGLAINEYAGGMPRGVQDCLYELAPRYIEALVRDREVADEAKRLMKETLVQQVA